MKRRLLLIILCIAPLSAWSQVSESKLDASTIYENAVKSVALVTCGKNEKISQGSGVILRSDGIIATNFHVCGDASSARIKLRNGDIYDDVTILDSDERKDIAILKIKAVGLPALTMADSDNVKIGSTVFAIGAPLGLEGSITSGIVSSIRPVGEMFSWADGFRVIQISASVSHGSSGCPLLNESGEVIGLVFAGRQDAQNLNAAIPINYVAPLIDSKRTGRVLDHLVLRQESTASTSGSESPKLTGTVNDLAGVYIGEWASDRYPVAGNIALTVTVKDNVASVSAVFTGSEYFNKDEFTTTFTLVGAGVWKMDYKGKKTKIKGTGLFKGGQFVGDYKFRKFIWTDVGRWTLRYTR